MLTIGTKWAIRLKGTDMFLPIPKNGHSGYSFTEPVYPDVAEPRLHNTYIGAQRALTSWLMGHHEAVLEYEDDSGPYCIGTNIKPQVHRCRENMEIVAVTMKVEP